MLTSCQQKYLAWELTRAHAADDVDKFTAVLADACVDLNPHQVEAALFAFRSPLSRGAILADEVGLGKTIEAALVIAQQWSEGHRNILIITPASLRKQWSIELQDKFQLPSTIFEKPQAVPTETTARRKTTAKKTSGKKTSKPLKASHSHTEVWAAQPGSGKALVICSYECASKQTAFLGGINWDLVVMDEAHKLRNVWQGGNSIALRLRNAFAPSKKLLLTATPLQNSAKDLFGLVSYIDPNFFGDIKTFNNEYGAVQLRNEATLADLHSRLTQFVQRTLRREVKEYVQYTERVANCQEYTPSNDEQRLSALVHDYLHRSQAWGLPNSQRQLIELNAYKQLSSSSFAIAGTLQTFIDRLYAMLKSGLYDAQGRGLKQAFGEDIEGQAECLEQRLEERAFAIDNKEVPMTAAEGHGTSEQQVEEPTAINEPPDGTPLTEDDRAAIQAEIDDLVQMRDLARDIKSNDKGACLLAALKAAFDDKRMRHEPEKALIFTESRRTQDYIRDLLYNNGYAEQVVLFNGTNNGQDAKDIYDQWKKRDDYEARRSGSTTADKRQALVEFFREKAKIMIATEAAAEGINLQFCSLVVNYDMPWNPQRVEQRIGRCHRYGQKSDVVVLNFVNRANRADRRIYQLLDEKFNLFKGVFGASDEVIGAVMDGGDFEHRVLDIFRSCRTSEEIDEHFNRLQASLQKQIDATVQSAGRKLLANFDSRVVEHVRLRADLFGEQLTRYSELLLRLTLSILGRNARHELAQGHAFRLLRRPDFAPPDTPIGLYTVGRQAEVTQGRKPLRYGHQCALAQAILQHALEADTSACPTVRLSLRSGTARGRLTQLEPYAGHSGSLICAVARFTCTAESSEVVLVGAVNEAGVAIPAECARLLVELEALEEAANSEPWHKAQLEAELLRLAELEKGKHASNTTLQMRAQVAAVNRWSYGEKERINAHMDELKAQADAKNREQENCDDADYIPLLEEERKCQAAIRKYRDEIPALEDKIDQEANERKARIADTLNGHLNTTTLFTLNWRLEA